MNDTIKGIIIVAAIASMLVVGATTMIPIMQNSFASKKSEDEQGTLRISKICPEACGPRFPITVTEITLNHLHSLSLMDKVKLSN
jgi:hypothetical protein